MVKLSIIIPVFNSASFITDTLQKIEDYIDKKGDIELIVVDDGSTDNTKSLIEQFALNRPHITTLYLPQNKGKGFAVREGIRAARGQYIAFTDTDLPYGLTILDSMLNILEKDHDMAMLYGSRSHVASIYKKGYSLFRKIGRYFFSYFIRFMVSLEVSDTQCGLKMITKNFAEAVLKKVTIDRFAFDVELFVLAKTGHYICQDLPVTLDQKQATSVRFVKDTVIMLLDVIKIRLKMQEGIYNS